MVSDSAKEDNEDDFCPESLQFDNEDEHFESAPTQPSKKKARKTKSKPLLDLNSQTYEQNVKDNRNTKERQKQILL